MIEYQDDLENRIENQLRIHWKWLCKKDYMDAVEFVNAIIHRYKILHGQFSKIAETTGRKS